MGRGFCTISAAVTLVVALILSDIGECQTPAPADAYLVGTIISKMFIGAVIKDAKGEQSFYRIHDKLPDGSQIVKVTDDHIALKGPDGSLFTMFILHEKTESHAVGQPSAPVSTPSVNPPAGVPSYQPATQHNPRPRRSRHSGSDSE